MPRLGNRRSDRRYKLKRWQTTRRAVIARDVWCIECHAAPVEDVDHIDPVMADTLDEEFFDPDRCQGLCHSCHARKTRAEQQPPAPTGGTRRSARNRRRH